MSSRPSEAETAWLWRAPGRSDQSAHAGPVAGRAGHYGEIAATFPISRMAVMRRLELLAEAELVTSRKRAGCVGSVSMLYRGRLRVGTHPSTAPGGTLVRFSFRAVGAIDPAIIEDIESVWTTLVASRLKALVETGSAEVR